MKKKVVKGIISSKIIKPFEGTGDLISLGSDSKGSIEDLKNEKTENIQLRDVDNKKPKNFEKILSVESFDEVSNKDTHNYMNTEQQEVNF